MSASARRQRAQLAREVIATLAEFFPQCFCVYERNRSKLKLHIDHDIAVATNGAITMAEIKGALRYTGGNPGYLRACRAGRCTHRSQRQRRR